LRGRGPCLDLAAGLVAFLGLVALPRPLVAVFRAFVVMLVSLSLSRHGTARLQKQGPEVARARRHTLQDVR
jgi:hypothetical protein